MRITEGVSSSLLPQTPCLIFSVRSQRVRFGERASSAVELERCATDSRSCPDSLPVCFHPLLRSSLLSTLHAYPVRSLARPPPRLRQRPSAASRPLAGDRAAAADVTTLSLCSGIVSAFFFCSPSEVLLRVAAQCGRRLTFSYCFGALDSSPCRAAPIPPLPSS